MSDEGLTVGRIGFGPLDVNGMQARVPEGLENYAAAMKAGQKMLRVTTVHDMQREIERLTRERDEWKGQAEIAYSEANRLGNERDKACATAEQYKQDWYAAKAEFWQATSKLRARVRELERLRDFDTGTTPLPKGLMLEHTRLDDMWQRLVRERDDALEGYRALVKVAPTPDSLVDPPFTKNKAFARTVDDVVREMRDE